MQEYRPDDYAFDEEDASPSRLARLRRGLSTAIGAAVAVSVLLALGVWFYRLGVRDAGNVPIIRASAEPAKERPEEPGGLVTPHQEIASYGIAESQPAKAAAAVIAPPPPEPKSEDVPMGTLPPAPEERPETPIGASAAAVTAPAPATPPRDVLPDALPVVTDAGATPAGAAGDEAQLAALSDTAGAAEVETDALANPATPAALPEPAADAAVRPGTPLPPRRPADLLARVEAAALAAERNAGDLARRAAESAVQVQLAADPDEQVIRSMWGRIRQANADLLRDRELAVQTTVSGGTTFYRLRVGPFGGMSEARAVCQALKARGQDCIVARNG